MEAAKAQNWAVEPQEKEGSTRDEMTVGCSSDVGLISTFVTLSLTQILYRAIADLHTFQFTVAHALVLSVFTSRLLATDLNTKSL
jgi:hypothetical protein